MRWVGVLALGVLVAVTSAAGASEIKSERVHFKKGASGATITGTISGRETIDYVLGAKAGQEMAVTLTTSNPGNAFNVLPPGSSDEAIFIGSISGNEFAGTLSVDGDYRIRVYLDRAGARRDEKAKYTLKVGITGGAHAAAAPAGDDAVARAGQRRFDATGDIPCAQHRGQPMGQCPFGVARDPGGAATVVVTHPDGKTRMLFFEKGRFLSADTSQADGNLEYGAKRESDLNIIRVGDERYEIPDAVVVGG